MRRELGSSSLGGMFPLRRLPPEAPGRVGAELAGARGEKRRRTVQEEENAWTPQRGELVGELTAGIFHEETFRHLLSREAQRAIRYQDFFSVCLLRLDSPAGGWGVSEEIERAMSLKIPEFVRATDIVGQISSATAVILLHTAGDDALRVAERLRSNIEQVAFREGPEGRPTRLTVSVGKVSFPYDGHDDATLLSQAMAYLEQAVDQGGNQVSHSPRGQE
jgi:diguanylate cyclase (GGDEF)-like protein